ncbi:DUF441 domain-containing protein [Desmospora profundinema]|uniref:UPF0756 membrane protein JOE21_001714 n=1 Tax=Desmospora profundinema TaxID=1571184 RepID=A0ABU1ILR7_9BACL|nr:DUF441 domain-containing protein [Desmospora profundinema]MDR6225716.1 uncharacterized membrane protein (DUF441 family) [Desmospora profundinema]
MDVFFMLLVIVGLGILSKNATVWIAGLGLLALRMWPSDQPLVWTDQYGLKIGVIILTMGVLSPIALGKIPWSYLVDTMKSVSGLIAVAVGIFVAYLGGRGVGLLTAQPTIVTGLLIGTIVGVALFRGVPVGPLIAAGILSLFVQWLK